MYSLSNSILELQKYRLRRFRDCRGSFWLDCPVDLKGMVMEPELRKLGKVPKAEVRTGVKEGL